MLQKARAPPKALSFERYTNERRYSRPLDDSLHDAGLSMKPHRKPLVHCVGTYAVGRPRRHVDPPIFHVVEPTMVLRRTQRLLAQEVSLVAAGDADYSDVAYAADEHPDQRQVHLFLGVSDDRAQAHVCFERRFHTWRCTWYQKPAQGQRRSDGPPQQVCPRRRARMSDCK